MENIIEKLDKIEDRHDFNSWSLKEIKQLFDLYYIISKKEKHLFKLIYKYHGCDSWEDIFRDYDEQYLKDKADGVEVALEEITNQIKK